MMQSLGRKYVQYFNRRYERSGTLWEGRFRSSLVQSEKYLLQVYQYIELNPVRAGMVNDPSDYSWSSYQINALGKHSQLMTYHPLYLSLGNHDFVTQVELLTGRNLQEGQRGRPRRFQ
jgi:putative transposase